MDQDKKRNQAKELSNIFEELVEIPDTDDNKKQYRAVDAWRIYFKDSDDILLLKNFFSILHLIEEIENILITYFDEKERKNFMHTTDRIKKFFSIDNLNIPWQTMKSRISDQIQHLYSISAVIKAYLNVEKISQDNLNDWNTSLSELYNEIFESDENDKLKEILCAQILNMLEAIKFYRFRGEEGIRNAVYTSMGAILFEHIKTHKKNNFTDKLIKILYNISIILNLATAPLEIPENISSFTQYITKSESLENIDIENGNNDNLIIDQQD